MNDFVIALAIEQGQLYSMKVTRISQNLSSLWNSVNIFTSTLQHLSSFVHSVIKFYVFEYETSRLILENPFFWSTTWQFIVILRRRLDNFYLFSSQPSL